MEELKKYLKEIGYSENDIEELVNECGISGLKPETLLDNIKRNYEFFISFGYSQEEVIKMTKMQPTIYSYSIENIKQKIEDLKNLGYSQKEIIKMTKTFPQLYGLSIESIKQKIEDLKNLGYSQEEVIKMTKNMPSIYGYSVETLKQKIKDLKELGYSQQEIIKMTKMQPTIYSYSIENIKQKIKDLKKLGYNQEEIIKMTKKLPTIYGYSIENIKQKIKFYDSIGLHSLAVKDSKKLMQSTALSYARYMFYKDNGISIDETNYRKLFIGQKKFVKQYGITKKELLAKYDYKKYMESIEKKNTQELGEETLEEQNDTEFIDSIDEEQAKHQKAIRNKEQRK